MSLVGIYHVLALLMANVFLNWPIPVLLVICMSLFMEHTITMDVIGGLTGVLMYKVVDVGTTGTADFIVALGALIMRSTMVAVLAAVLTKNPVLVGTTVAIWLVSPWPELAQCTALLVTLFSVMVKRHEVEQPPATPHASPHR